MNRINEMGMQLIQYKGELSKDYPKLVKDSLLLALEQMVENKVVDLDTFGLIKDSSVSDQEFNEYLLTKPAFSKSHEEIMKEFEVVREQLNKKFESAGMAFLETESVPERDIISASKRYSIGEQFVLDYFGVEEKDLLKLMKRRGFVEKFAVLRLTAIFKDILSKITANDAFNVDASLVYFNTEEEGYSIDLVFEIKVEKAENEDVEEMINDIREITAKVNEMYAEKTVV